MLSLWLGTPQEKALPSQVFAKLGLPEFPTERVESLAYNRLFFVRLEFDESARRDFLRALTDFQVGRGVPEKPVSLRLERPWWDPPLESQGTVWSRGDVTVWSPDDRPGLFYVVLATQKAGAAELPRP